MLTDKMIKDGVGTSAAYKNGSHYFKSGCVFDLRVNNNNINEFSAIVKGGRRHSVHITFDDNGEIAGYDCDCPAFHQDTAACKHVAAVLKAIQSRWDEYFGTAKKTPLTGKTKALFDFFNNINLEKNPTLNTAKPVNTRIVPILCFSIITGRKQNWLEFSIGNKRLYIMKNIRDFVEALVNGTDLNYGKDFVFRPDEAVYDDLTKELIVLLKNEILDENNMFNGRYLKDPHYGNYNSGRTSCFENRRFILSNANLLKVLEIMKDISFDMYVNEQKSKDVKIIEERPSFKLDIGSCRGGVKTSLDMERDVYYGLDNDYHYIYHKNAIYKTDPLFADYVAPLMKCFKENKKPEILIPDTEIQDFFSSVVPEIERIASVNVEASLSERFYRSELEKQVYFNRHGEGISAKINFKYDELEINPLDSGAKAAISEDQRTLLRDLPGENRLIGIFEGYGFEKRKGMYVLDNESSLYEFLRKGLEEIRLLSEVYYSDDFKNISIKNSGRISAGVRINSGTGLLEMNMHYEDMDPKDLMDLLASYKLKKKYHRLRAGHFISLDSPGFQATAELIDQLDLSHADMAKETIELPLYRAMYLDSLARESGELRIERSSDFEKMVQDISAPQEMEFALPEGIRGKLRDYQKVGYK